MSPAALKLDDLVEKLGGNCRLASLAARMLQAFPDNCLEESDFRKVGIASTSNGQLLRALNVLSAQGWCNLNEGRWQATSNMPSELPSFLEGAAAMGDLKGSQARADPIITMPKVGSRLATALRESGPSYVQFTETQEMFRKMAEEALKSITVMTPFVNPQGLEWIYELMDLTRAPEKTLILRIGDNDPPLDLSRLEKLKSLGVKAYNYWLSHGNQIYETFHAKLFMIDEIKAYVGSANFLIYDRQSMELGMAVEGKPLQPIIVLVNAIKSIAKPV